eukprot:357606-Chlamydomonas_euryale.AAC.4
MQVQAPALTPPPTRLASPDQANVAASRCRHASLPCPRPHAHAHRFQNMNGSNGKPCSRVVVALWAAPALHARSHPDAAAADC